MFNNSLSVLSSIARSLKRYLFWLGIVTQTLFIAYYTYLIVTNYQVIHLVVPYASVLLFAIILLFIDIFTRDISDSKSKILKVRTKRLLTGLSWFFKAAVISYNIYITITHDVTEASKMFLIFSSIFLIVQILSSLFGWLLSYYSELFLYALKMDYENIIDEKDDPNQRPIGQALNKFTNEQDHKDKVNELAVKYELYGSIKDEIKREGTIRFNGKVVKKKKAEKIVLRYYKKASKYYSSPKKIYRLLGDINIKLMQTINGNDKAFLLEFFLRNSYEQNYVGLSEHAIKLIIGCFLFLLDDNNKDIIDVVYKALTKEIIDIKEWSVVKKPLTPNSGLSLKVERAMNIAKDTKTQYELYKDETIGSEFESLIFKVVKDSAIENGRIMLKKKIRKFFKKD